MILFSTFCKMPKGKIFYRVTFPASVYKQPVSPFAEVNMAEHSEDFVSKSAARKAAARYECIGIFGEVFAVAKEVA